MIEFAGLRSPGPHPYALIIIRTGSSATFLEWTNMKHIHGVHVLIMLDRGT